MFAALPPLGRPRAAASGYEYSPGVITVIPLQATSRRLGTTPSARSSTSFGETEPRSLTMKKPRKHTKPKRTGVRRRQAIRNKALRDQKWRERHPLIFDDFGIEPKGDAIDVDTLLARLTANRIPRQTYQQSRDKRVEAVLLAFDVVYAAVTARNRGELEEAIIERAPKGRQKKDPIQIVLREMIDYDREVDDEPDEGQRKKLKLAMQKIVSRDVRVIKYLLLIKRPPDIARIHARRPFQGLDRWARLYSEMTAKPAKSGTVTRTTVAVRSPTRWVPEEPEEMRFRLEYLPSGLVADPSERKLVILDFEVVGDAKYIIGYHVAGRIPREFDDELGPKLIGFIRRAVAKSKQAGAQGPGCSAGGSVSRSSKLSLE